MRCRDIKFTPFFWCRCWRCEAITGCPENTTGKSGCTRSGRTWNWTCHLEFICQTVRSTRTAAWPSCICGIPNKYVYITLTSIACCQHVFNIVLTNDKYKKLCISYLIVCICTSHSHTIWVIRKYKNIDPDSIYIVI